MKTYKEVIYLILDEIKALSDDSVFTLEHVKFLMVKHRALLLKLRYSDIKKPIPYSNYLTVNFTVNYTDILQNVYDNTNSKYKISTEDVPTLMNIGTVTLSSKDYLKDVNLTYVSRERLRYTGYNKYLSKNTIYCAVGIDDKLHVKAVKLTDGTTPLLRINNIKITGIYEDCEQASGKLFNALMEDVFPLENALIQPLVDICVKELLGASYRPADTNNNANDDLSDLATFLRKNVKSGLQKQIEG